METDLRRKPSNFLRLLAYTKPFWPLFVGATFCGMIKFLVPTSIFWAVGEAIGALEAANAGKVTAEQAWGTVQHYVLIGLAISVLSPLPIFLRTIWGARAVRMVVQKLRCDLFAHVQRLSHSFYDANRSGSLTSRVVGDVETIQPFLNQGLIQGWMNAAQIIVILGFFFTQNVTLALLSLVLIPFQMLVQRKIGFRVKANAKEIRNQLAWLSGATQEKLAAATVVKAFTREEDEVQRFNDDSAALVDMGLRNSYLNGISQLSASLLTSLAPLIVIFFGGRMGLFSDAIPIKLLVQFVLMQGQLYSPFERLNETQLVTATALGATDRIFEIFDTEPEVADKPDAAPAPPFAGDIRFAHVVFGYPNASSPTLNGLDLIIPAKTTTALVGPSGGGKTTITNLLNRFYAWQEGGILIDGRDIRDYTLYSLRSQIALVPQDPVLFSGTIEGNILYGRPDATPEEIRLAAERAYALDFIEALDDGFDTLLGERGLRLSGGQKQRIAIARAFLKDPAILILDEATSALDSESERQVQQALDDLMRDRTTLVIAHRLATVRHADQIAVIAGGRVVECGRHEALLPLGGIYATLCRQQFGAEAVEA